MSERIKADDTKGYIRRRRVFGLFSLAVILALSVGSLTLSIMFCCGISIRRRNSRHISNPSDGKAGLCIWDFSVFR